MSNSPIHSHGRTRSIRLSVTDDELMTLKRLAALSGFPVATWIRSVALGIISQPKPKQIEAAKQPEYTEEYAEECRRRAYSFGGTVEPTPTATGKTEAEQHLSIEEFERAMTPKHSDDE